MVGTQVKFDERLERTVIVRSAEDDLSDAFDHYLAAHLFVVDGFPWSTLEGVRSGLIPKRRTFKSPFHAQDDISDEVWAATEIMTRELQGLFDRMYPQVVWVETNKSFRPMITRDEPMHFDTYSTPPAITSFINVAETSRRYRVGPTFPQLVQEQPDAMRHVIEGCNGDLKHLSYIIRDRTFRDLPPIARDCPSHAVDFAPGAVWFFNAKLVSHEVVYGEGALGHSWEVPSAGVRTQLDYIEGLTI